MMYNSNTIVMRNIYVTGRKGVYLTESPDKIQWHPAFCAATEVELKDNIHELQLISEYNLSKQPIRMDLLIVKNNNNGEAVKIKNEIGHIMRRYNIIEYKSPVDGLTIDDFVKTLAYTYMYKGCGKHVNYIPLEDMTVSIFTNAFPRRMFEQLKKKGLVIAEMYSGIYYITGELLIPVQIVVISRLEAEKHSSLRILSDREKKEDVERFLEEAELLKSQSDRDNVDALLQASVMANFELYEEIRSENDMCEALRLLMKDEIKDEMDKMYSEGICKGRREGRRTGKIEGKLESIKSIMSKLSYTAEQAMDLLEIPQSQRDMLMKRL